MPVCFRLKGGSSELPSGRSAAAEQGPPEAGPTLGDNSVDVSLVLTADRWIALTHRRKNRRGEMEGMEEGGQGGEEESESESPEDDSPALLSVQRAGV